MVPRHSELAMRTQQFKTMPNKYKIFGQMSRIIKNLGISFLIFGAVFVFVMMLFNFRLKMMVRKNPVK